MANQRHVVVVGLGRFGMAAAITLFDVGHEVLAVDQDRRLVQEASERVTHAAQADATDEAALRELGVGEFDTGIVGISAAIEPSILVTLNLKRLGVPHVIAKAQTTVHAEILQRVGADRTVFPEREMGIQVAHSFTVPSVVGYLPIGTEFGISKLALPDALVGKTLGSLALEDRYGVRLLIVERRGRALVAPARESTLQTGDFLIVSGPDEAMERLGTL